MQFLQAARKLSHARREAAHRAWLKRPCNDQRPASGGHGQNRGTGGQRQQGTVVSTRELAKKRLLRFELEPDEALMDPAMERPSHAVFEAVERLSGGALLGRRRARVGYKFYAITKGSFRGRGSGA